MARRTQMTASPAATPPPKAPNHSPTLPVEKTGIVQGPVHNGMTLRGQRDAHPAKPDMPAPRRPHEVVQAEKKAKQKKKDERTTKQQNAIEKTALLEDTMQLQEEEAARTANHPITSKAVKKPRVNLKKVPAESQTPSEARDAEGPVVEESSELDDSGNEKFELDGSDNESDDSDEGQPRKKKLAVKSKTALRETINEKRQNPEPALIPTPTPEPAKKKPKANVGGLRADWLQANASKINTPKRITSEPSSQVGASIAPIATVAHAVQEDDEYKFGGLVGEENDMEERKELGTAGSKDTEAEAVAAVVKAHVLVKIEETTSVSGFVSPDKTKKTITLNAFPDKVQKAFTDHFIPSVLDFVGCLKAWTGLEAQEYSDLWETTTSDEVKNAWDQLNGPKRLLEVLTNDRINSWRSKFGTTAINVLDDIFTREQLETAEDKKAYVETQLQGNPKSRAFYFLHSGEVNGAMQYAGTFQSELIARTFAEHLKAIRQVPKDLRQEMKPTGALVLSILAVLRALEFYKTGVFIKPMGNNGHFSERAWGDRIIQTQGRTINIKTTTELHELFEFNQVKNTPRVSDTQWKRILATAQSYIAARRGGSEGYAPVQQKRVDPEDWMMPELAQSKASGKTEIDAADIAGTGATVEGSIDGTSQGEVTTSTGTSARNDIIDDVVMNSADGEGLGNISGEDEEEGDEEEDEEEQDEGSMQLKAVTSEF
ncbi:hypothetical protein D9758_013418 [Tetrapyrgos nigripes]|uniref:Uncharacterized protein n=1 Tax=Tetrapyrgos nigripes TaxID=182062 RepID=A0A8H5FNR3_9AGAR|nr:hypothetical protein D9758_013418 [Tetrapyrgos nigripes]